MRKLLISLAAAGSAIALATPASAQIFGNIGVGLGSPGYGYNGYGYNNYGQVRSLQYRIDAVEHQINRLDRYDRIGDRQADRLRWEANSIERRLRIVARYGLNPYEAQDINVRIARLEQRVQFAMASRYGRYGYNNGYGYNGYDGYRDRDSDHRWDRDRDDDRDDD